MRAQPAANILVVASRRVYPFASRNLMCRFTANSIVVALLALLLAPATLFGDSHKLCCRHARMHHCEGTSGAAPDESETSFNSNGAKCPMSCCASTAHAKFAAPRFQTSFHRGYTADTLIHKQIALRSDLRGSNLRDRSPPFLS
jgi:hypothetical protein